MANDDDSYPKGVRHVILLAATTNKPGDLHLVCYASRYISRDKVLTASSWYIKACYLFSTPSIDQLLALHLAISAVPYTILPTFPFSTYSKFARSYLRILSTNEPRCWISGCLEKSCQEVRAQQQVSRLHSEENRMGRQKTSHPKSKDRLC